MAGIGGSAAFAMHAQFSRRHERTKVESLPAALPPRARAIMADFVFTRRCLQRPETVDAFLSAVDPLELPAAFGRMILESACEEFGVSVNDVLSTSRHRELVSARVAAVAVLHTHTTMSWPEIATLMGRTNHTGVFNSYQRFGKSDIATRRNDVPRAWRVLTTFVRRVRRSAERELRTERTT